MLPTFMLSTALHVSMSDKSYSKRSGSNRHGLCLAVPNTYMAVVLIKSLEVIPE